ANNPVFSQDDEKNINVPYESFQNIESDLDNLHVGFSQDDSAVIVNNSQDANVPEKASTSDEDDIASDEDVATHVSNKDDT
ncbi:unnamed protein product, partial [Rotaria magnacalcarata]